MRLLGIRASAALALSIVLGAGIFAVPRVPGLWLFLPGNVHRDNPAGDSNLEFSQQTTRTAYEYGYVQFLCPTYYYQGLNGLGTDNPRALTAQAEVNSYLATTDSLGVKVALQTAKLSKSHMGKDRVDCNYVVLRSTEGEDIPLPNKQTRFLCTEKERFPFTLDGGSYLHYLTELKCTLSAPARVRWFPDKTSGKTVDAYLEAGEHRLHLPVVTSDTYCLMVEPVQTDAVEFVVTSFRTINPPLQDTMLECASCYIGHARGDSVVATYPFLPQISPNWTLDATMPRFVTTAARVLATYKAHPSVAYNLANGDEYYCTGYLPAEQGRWGNVGAELADVYGTYSKQVRDSSGFQTVLWADMFDRGHNAVQYDYANNPANGGCSGGLAKLSGKEPIVFMVWGYDFKRTPADSILAYWRSFSDKGFSIVVQVSDNPETAKGAADVYQKIPWMSTAWGFRLKSSIKAFVVYTEDREHCSPDNLKSIAYALRNVAKTKVPR